MSAFVPTVICASAISHLPQLPVGTNADRTPFSPPREGTRRSLFEAIERAALKPLPAEPFVIGQWLMARFNIDYHIVADRHFYSVPFRLAHRKLDVFLTATAVTAFADGERVASHVRSYHPGQAHDVARTYAAGASGYGTTNAGSVAPGCRGARCGNRCLCRTLVNSARASRATHSRLSVLSRLTPAPLVVRGEIS